MGRSARTPGSSGAHPPAELTPRDVELLRFLAEQRFLLADHVRSLFGASTGIAQDRLRALRSAGLITSRRIFHGQPSAHQITRRGLAAIASELPAPHLDLRCYGHDIDLAWVHLAARRGAFGSLRQIISEREMRSADGRGAKPRHGVRLGGVGAHGRERLHYPDLVLVTESGHRVAVEVELSAKGRGRRDRILAGYGGDSRVDAVLYLVRDMRLADSIQAAARRLGISDRVRVCRAISSSGELGAPSPAGRQRIRPAARIRETAR